MKHVCLFLFCFFGGMSAGWAQQPSADVSFELNLSYDTIGLEEMLTLNYVLHNTKLIGNFIPPTIDNIQSMTGPNTSQSYSSINGNTTTSVTYTYFIQPQQLGLLFLPAVSVETQAGILEVAERTVVVVAEAPTRPFSPAAPSMSRSPFDHPFFQQQGIRPQEDVERLQELFQQPLDRPSETAPKPKKERKTYRI